MLTAKNFSELIGLENFLTLLNYFQQSVKLRLCEMMLNFFIKQESVFSDQYHIHTVLTIAK